MCLRPIPLLLAAATPFAGLAAQQQPAHGVLRAVEVRCGDVFDTATTSTSRWAALVDSVHWQTREEVVRREIWLSPGVDVTAEQAAEVERHLRGLGLFAEVTARLEPVGDGTVVDLVVTTRDRLTLFLGASGSYVGGVSGFRVAAGEGNLFGLGDRVGASYYENSEGDSRGSFSYTDRHLFDTLHAATLRASRTDDGDSFGIDVHRPLQHLADPRSHGFAFHVDEDAVEYYRGGDEVASVGQRTRGGSADLTWAFGPADRRHTIGPVFAFDERDYDRAKGVLGPEIRVPGDTTTLSIGLAAGGAFVDGYRELQGYDTLDYVQDVALGVTWGAALGARWRDEDGAGDTIEPTAEARVAWAFEPWEGTLLQCSARGSMRWRNGRPVGEDGQLGGWAFVGLGEHDVLAGSATLDVVDEREDLPVELTLGADNGLRGYGAREFSGTSRLRVHVEERRDLGFELATLHLGSVLFWDVGWCGDHADLGRPYDAIGVGLRVGSRALFGDSLLRIDLAYPLDDVQGEDGGWQLDVSVGQVFTFGGNANTLGTR